MKEMEDLYTEDYKMLIKEIKEDSKKYKDIPCFCIGSPSHNNQTKAIKSIQIGR